MTLVGISRVPYHPRCIQFPIIIPQSGAQFGEIEELSISHLMELVHLHL